MWDVKKRSGVYADDLEKVVDEYNDHNQVMYIKKQVAIIDNMEFLTRAVWKAEGAGFVNVMVPAESQKRPETKRRGNRRKSSFEGEKSCVRAKYQSALRISQDGNETKLEYVIQPDAGGRVPRWVIDRYMGSNLAFVTEIQEYFQQLRTMEQYDREDGRALGLRLMYPDAKNRKKPRRAAVGLVEKHWGLKELRS